MPTSDASAISPIVVELQRLRPSRVLDVGPGYGKYGWLCREYLGPILTQLDAAEPWPQGMFGVAPALYDRVFPEPFPGQRAWEPYDLILLVDVLEHYEHEDGLRALDVALSLATNVLISTPRLVLPQGQVDGNPWEEHKSQWTAQLLAERATVGQLVHHPYQLIVTLSRSTTP